jgi:hypothetical protein
MDTPTCPIPEHPGEREVLTKLSIIRDKLLLLKQDRTNYIRSQDVLPLYEDTMEQVRKLNEIRTGDVSDENQRGNPSCFTLRCFC